MMNKYKKLISFICLIVVSVLPQLALAANNPPLNVLDEVASGQGPYQQANSTTLMEIIGVVIGVALSLIGIIFLVLMIYGGYNWMIARGEEEKVTQAKDTITRAVIGLIIVVGAYAVWRFLFSKLFI